MQVIDTKIDGVKVIQPTVFSDTRGFYGNVREASLSRHAGYRFGLRPRQLFTLFSGVLRGLHYQDIKPQGKLVRVVRGEVYDVAVDIRPDSPTFGKWEGIVLSEENKTQLWIPPGLAHGFVVLSEIADFEYKCTDYYSPEHERCLMWNDPDVGVAWPVRHPVLSEKDKNGKFLRELI